MEKEGRTLGDTVLERDERVCARQGGREQRSAWGVWKAGPQLGWDSMEEKEQQGWRWDGSKALRRGAERGGASDPWPREEPSQLVMYLD